jgi:hypothetical protein
MDRDKGWLHPLSRLFLRGAMPLTETVAGDDSAGKTRE